MKVLITGGAGFIGHNTAIFLKDCGFDVLVFDNFKRATDFAISRLNGIEIIKGDVNSTIIRKALNNVDVVIHAAAYTNVSESLKKPILYFRNNVIGTLNVVKSCLEKNIKLLIFLSSASIYGEPKFLPISEDHPTSPISPYGLTKLMGEDIVKFYSKQGLKYIIMRLFNVYGPGQNVAYAGVITKFIERIKSNKPPIIYGSGLQTRDFIHVRDVAMAIMLSIERGLENEVLNIATGKPISIKSLAELIIRLANSPLKPIFTKPRTGDIMHSYANIVKAEKLLGFKPRITLEEGLRELLEMQKSKNPFYPL